MQDRTAPLRFRLLGEAHLEGEGGELTRILAQPRRFALLARLALAGPGGFLRRDHLLAMFWPEADESRARASLRQALRYLRKGLGKGVLTGRGDQEVGVDPARLDCDVVAFDRALDAGRDGEALELYRGPLLPGFGISGAPEFERWLAGERRRLRAAAVDAAMRLVSAAEEAGDVQGAAELARRAGEIDPVNEAVARRLMVLLDRKGDRGSALAAYGALVRRLEEEFDLPPAPETEAVLARIRGRDQGEPGRTGPLAAGSEGPGAAHRTPDASRVVVTRFRNHTGRDELDVIEAMAADWITQGLATLQELTVMPPVLAREGGGAGDPSSEPPTYQDQLNAVSAQTGAGTVIGGAFYLDDGALRLRVRIVDTVANRIISPPDDVVASLERPMDGLEELSRRVNACLAPVLSPRAVHVRSGVRPPSFEAYRAYMEGLELFIRGRWEPALERFRQAAEAEPEYALPRIVQAITHWNLGQLAEAEAVAREASRHREGVGPFESAVLDMVRAWLAGDWLGAHEAVRVQAGIAPGSIPHFQVAEEARRLNRPFETLDVLSRLDPETGELAGWIFYWIELTTAHHMVGDHAAELEAARRTRALHPDDPAALLLEVRALAALGDRDALGQVLDEAATLPGGAPSEGGRGPRVGELLREAALELAAHGHAEAGQEMAARSAAWYEEWVREGSPAALRRDLARSLYHAGRLDEAQAIFRELAGSGPPVVAPVGFHHGHLQAHMDHGYLAVLAARQGDLDAVEAWRRRLREASGPFLYGAHWFWLACLDAVTGEHDRAVARLRRALAEGLPHEMFLHADSHLLCLRSHPRYEAIMRPRR